MITAKTTIKMYEYVDKILEIIENKDEFTQSDLQSALGVIVLDAMSEQK